jgi:hypothetical protein
MMADVKTTTPVAVKQDGAPVRRKRASHGLARLRLSVPKEIPGYYCRWVNDDGVEVEWRLQNDYEFVAPTEVGLDDPENTRVRRLVGTKENGDALYAYLMKIRQEWRDSDVEEEGELQRRFEQQVKSGTIVGEGTSADHRYIPKAGISIS